MTQRIFFLQQNILQLEQGISLIENLDPESYALCGHEYFSSGIGKHFRHIVDHYNCFLKAGGARVDYDARDRDPRVESDRNHALNRFRSVVVGLEQLVGEELAGDDRLIVSGNEGENPDGVSRWCDSTVVRELQYLSSHTVHHYAIIAMIVRILGGTVPDDFGVAPSTLVYERKQKFG